MYFKVGVAQWLIGSTLLSTHPADTLPNTRRMFIMQATVPFGKQRRRLRLPLPHPFHHVICRQSAKVAKCTKCAV